MILINVAYGVSQVFFNAFLPLLVKNHPEYVDLKGRLPNALENDPDLLQKADFLGNMISGWSFIYGYFASVIALVLSALFLGMWRDSLAPVRICIAISGVWWAAFSLLLTFSRLRDRPGPSLPPGEKHYLFSIKKCKYHPEGYFSDSSISSLPSIMHIVYHTFKEYKRIPNTFTYLLSYFMFSDGHSTINMVSVLFAKDELKMETFELISMTILVCITALLGNFFYMWLQKKLSFSSKQMNLLLLILLSLIPIYSLLGFLSPVLGIRTKIEMFFIAAFYGFNIG